MGFPGGNSGKETACQCRNVGDTGSVPGRSPGGGRGNPLQYSCLENPVGGETGGLQSIALQRVRHDRSDLASTHAGASVFAF